MKFWVVIVRHAYEYDPYENVEDDNLFVGVGQTEQQAIEDAYNAVFTDMYEGSCIEDEFEGEKENFVVISRCEKEL